MAVLSAPADAPLILQLGASALLYAHIAGGSAGMATGVVALAARKGAAFHKAAGSAFFIAMLFMSGVALVTAPFTRDGSTGQWINTCAAALTFYLVVSSWLTVKRRPGETGRAEAAMLAFPIGAAVVGLGLLAANWGTPRAGAYGPIYLFAAIGTLAAVRDLLMIRRGGIMGADRLARHLWRMCLALAIALGSFFLGQQRFLPEVMQGGPWLAAPALATLGVMAFWLVRYRIQAMRRRRPSRPMVPSAAGQAS